jgi:hypothetical protein
VILKGSKLFFYKPPSSLIANGIKELFPTSHKHTLGDLVEEEVQVGIVDISAKKEVPSSTMKRRRVYWGRSTHPDLVLRSGEGMGVVKGTGEALVHEIVFGSTFGGEVIASCCFLCLLKYF